MESSRSAETPIDHETRTSYLFLAPFLVIFLVFLVFPIFYSFYLSFFEKFGGYELTDLRWVGFDNYFKLLGFHFDGGRLVPNDIEFWWSLLMTLYYALLAIPSGIIASLGLALLLGNRLPMKELFRSAFFLPNMLDMLVVSIIWVMIYAPKYGVMAQFLDSLGLQWMQNVGLLGNPYTALPAIVFAMTLKGSGFGMILFLSAIQNIPGDIYEAADIDGANSWEKFRHITLPLIRPVIVFMIITGIIGALNAFTEIYAMTQGGPNIVVGGYSLGATQLTGYYLYKTFDHGDYGYAAAISYVLLGLTLLLSFINIRFFNKNEEAE